MRSFLIGIIARIGGGVKRGVFVYFYENHLDYSSILCYDDKGIVHANY